MKVILLTDDTGMPLCFPDSAVIAEGTPYFYTEGEGDTEVRLWCGAVIERLGKCIDTRFARRYYSRMVCGTCNSERGADTGSNLMRDGAVCAGRASAEPGAVATTDCGAAVTLPSCEVIDAAIARVSRLATLKTGDIVGVILGPSMTLRHGIRRDIYIGGGDGKSLLHAKYR